MTEPTNIRSSLVDPICNTFEAAAAPEEFAATLNARGLYSTTQFVLRLSPRMHELVDRVYPHLPRPVDGSNPSGLTKNAFILNDLREAGRLEPIVKLPMFYKRWSEAIEEGSRAFARLRHNGRRSRDWVRL